MARRQVALLPLPIFVFPFAFQARDHRRRQIGRVLAQQGRQRFLEVARRNPAQIKSRQQRIQTLRAPRPFGQDVRCEPYPPLRRYVAIAGFRPFNLHRPDPRLDRANRIVPMTNHALPPIGEPKLRVISQKRREFRFYRLRDQPTRAGSQDFGERIIDGPFLSKANNSILMHGVTLLREVRVVSAPTPLRRLPHTVTQFPA